MPSWPRVIDNIMDNVLLVVVLALVMFRGPSCCVECEQSGLVKGCIHDDAGSERGPVGSTEASGSTVVGGTEGAEPDRGSVAQPAEQVDSTTSGTMPEHRHPWRVLLGERCLTPED